MSFRSNLSLSDGSIKRQIEITIVYCNVNAGGRNVVPQECNETKMITITAIDTEMHLSVISQIMTLGN
jgi:hypothetical protein